jgi:aspartyl-tRNA(Asn)/glutamyl-tRNA(Gln) amidotransferase subunit B
VQPSAEWIAEVAASIPPLPAARRSEVAAASGLDTSAEPVITVVRLDLDHYVAAVALAGGDAALAVRRLANEVASDMDGIERLRTDAFVELVKMEANGTLTTTQARTVLKELLESGGDPASAAARLGFEAMGADDLATAVDQVISEHPGEWARFAGGEDKLTSFFMPLIKAATGGKADLKAASALLRARRQ